MSRINDAKKLMAKLHKFGYEAYIVGGFVRDYLLGKTNSDIDIATNATPDIVKAMFKRTILTGIKHGTVTVIYNGAHYEITTYRTEGAYINNRKPEEVYFVSSLEEDIKRRDFTMNAIALSIDGKIIDYVNGREDIKRKLIKAVGDPYLRFSEDALRMLRAFRFVSVLGFSIDNHSKLAIIKHGHLVKNISYERILKEIEYIIKGPYMLNAVDSLIELSFNNHLPIFSGGFFTIHKTRIIPEDLTEFLAICAVTSSIEEILTLPISNQIKKDISLVYEMYNLDICHFSPLVLFRNGLKSAFITNKLNVFLKNKADNAREINEIYEAMPIHKVCDLAFKGEDLIKIFKDKKPGSWIGEIIDDLCLKVLLGELTNEKDVLQKYVFDKYI